MMGLELLDLWGVYFGFVCVLMLRVQWFWCFPGFELALLVCLVLCLLDCMIGLRLLAGVGLGWVIWSGLFWVFCELMGCGFVRSVIVACEGFLHGGSVLFCCLVGLRLVCCL